jgi:hypothetical protein
MILQEGKRHIPGIALFLRRGGMVASQQPTIGAKPEGWDLSLTGTHNIRAPHPSSVVSRPGQGRAGRLALPGRRAAVSPRPPPSVTPRPKGGGFIRQNGRFRPSGICFGGVAALSTLRPGTATGSVLTSQQQVANYHPTRVAVKASGSRGGPRPRSSSLDRRRPVPTAAALLWPRGAAALAQHDGRKLISASRGGAYTPGQRRHKGGQLLPPLGLVDPPNTSDGGSSMPPPSRISGTRREAGAAALCARPLNQAACRDSRGACLSLTALRAARVRPIRR